MFIYAFFAARTSQTNEDLKGDGSLYLFMLADADEFLLQAGNLDFRVSGSSEPGIGSGTSCSR